MRIVLPALLLRAALLPALLLGLLLLRAALVPALLRARLLPVPDPSSLDASVPEQIRPARQAWPSALHHAHYRHVRSPGPALWSDGAHP